MGGWVGGWVGGGGGACSKLRALAVHEHLHKSRACKLPLLDCLSGCHCACAVVLYCAGVPLACCDVPDCLPTRAGMSSHRAVYGAAVAKNVMPLQLVKGCGAACPAMGSASSEEEVHCEVEVGAAAALLLPPPTQPSPHCVQSQVFRVYGQPLFHYFTAIIAPAPQGFVSNAEYSGKKTQVVLFINGRAGEHAV